MKWIRRISISLTVTFFAVCCGMLLLFNWSGLGWQALSIPTGSMRPNIPPSSLVLVHRVPLSSLKVGDVITYINPLNMRTTITHRIIKSYKINGVVPAFVTQGDANPTSDRPIVGGLVQGKVLWHVPSIGSWLMWSKHTQGLLVLVYLPALLLMLEEVKRMSDYLKSQQPYRLPGWQPVETPRSANKLVIGGALASVMVLASAFVWQPALALLKSNTVTLANNNLTVAAKPVTQCSGHTTNTNNVSVSNSSTQTAASGSATASGNTNTGNVSSGSASNSSSSSTSISVTNC